jgi:Homeodomain-like domain
MPKILRVRAAQDEQEERQVRKLAASRHGPADRIIHARMVARSWDGERVEAIAKELQCSAQTVRRRLHHFTIVPYVSPLRSAKSSMPSTSAGDCT